MVRSFLDKPRITISTIHQSKGGEADNVVLITDMGRLLGRPSTKMKSKEFGM